MSFSYSDPDGISSGASFTAQTATTLGGSNSYARLSLDPPNGFSSSRVELTTNFDMPVQDLAFTLYDIDNGTTTWGDDIVITAFNGTTPVTVTLTPVFPGRHNVNGGHVEAVGGSVASSNPDANVLVQIDGPITSFVVNYGYASNVTASNADYQIMGISDFSFQRFNQPTVTSLESETDPAIDVAGLYGTINWNVDGSYIYTLDNNNAAVQALGVGEILTETFEYTLVDLRGNSDSGTLTITIHGTNDGPTTTNSSVLASEDVPYEFSLTDFGFTDIDNDGLVQIQITNLETVGELKLSGADVVLGQVITAADITAGNLTFVSTNHGSGSPHDSFEFRVHDGTEYSAGTAVMTVNVTAVADAPMLSTPASITTDEDAGVALGVLADLVDTDGSETLSVIISGVIEGATITDGTSSFTGTLLLDTVDVSAWNIAQISVLPPADADGEFNLTVTTTATEASNGDTASSVATIDVIVNAVADAPTLSTPANVTLNEDGTSPPLGIAASLQDTDGSEALNVTISGIVEGATITDGTHSFTGTAVLNSVDVSTWTLANITVTPPLHSDAEFQLVVTATATESTPTSADLTVTTLTAQTSATIDVQVDAVADAPTLTVNATATGDEDNAIALTINSSLVDADGSESLLISLSGVPNGALLSAGTNLGGGLWALTPAQLSGLTITPPPNSDSEFRLTVTATATETNPTSGNTTVTTLTAQTSATIDVQVDAVADAPTLSVTSSVTGDEDHAIALTITSSLIDTDSSETLSITIDGVPTGAVLSTGTDNLDGSWTLTPGQLAGLTITPPAHNDGEFQLTVTATATETNPTSGDTTVTTLAAQTAPRLMCRSTPWRMHRR